MKKIISLLLTVLMCISLLPVTAVEAWAEPAPYDSKVYDHTWFWPTDFKLSSSNQISSAFGDRYLEDTHWFHNGVDIPVYKENVYATEDGTVSETGFNDFWGYYIIIYHEEFGVSSSYMHLNEKPYFSKGDSVKRGDKIAKSGKTGTGTGYHLDFRIFKGKEHYNENKIFYNVNPKYLDGKEITKSCFAKNEWYSKSGVDWCMKYTTSRHEHAYDKYGCCVGTKDDPGCGKYYEEINKDKIVNLKGTVKSSKKIYVKPHPYQGDSGVNQDVIEPKTECRVIGKIGNHYELSDPGKHIWYKISYGDGKTGWIFPNDGTVFEFEKNELKIELRMNINVIPKGASVWANDSSASYNWYGKVKSSDGVTNIESVTFMILKSDGTLSASSNKITKKPNKTSYTVSTSDDTMQFSKLAAGNYILKIEATDANKNQASATYNFRVAEGDSEPTPSEYLAMCEYTKTNCDIKITAESTSMKTLPCSKDTNSNSKEIVIYYKGGRFKATGIYKNTYDNYWYECEYDGKTGYIYAGDTKYDGVWSPDICTASAYAFEEIKAGDSSIMHGTISSDYGKFYVGGKIQGTSNTGETINIEQYDKTLCQEYVLEKSELEKKFKVEDIPEGKYTVSVYAYFDIPYATDAKTLNTDKRPVEIIKQDVTINPDDPKIYTVTYDLLDGKWNGPDSQTKTEGIDLTLSSEVPSLEGYSFIGWLGEGETITGDWVVTKPEEGDYETGYKYYIYGYECDHCRDYGYDYDVDFTFYCGTDKEDIIETVKKYPDVYGTYTPHKLRRFYMIESSDKGDSFYPGKAGSKYNYFNADYVAEDGSTGTASIYKTPFYFESLVYKWDVVEAVIYQPGDVYTEDRDLNLVAIWEEKMPETYNVTFDPGIGTGGPENMTVTGDTFILPEEVPYRENWNFIFWWGKSGDNLDSYYPGETYFTTGDIDMLAIFEPDWRPEISAENVTGKPGETVAVGVYLSEAKDLEDTTIRFSLDCEGMELLRYENAGSAPQNGLLSTVYFEIPSDAVAGDYPVNISLSQYEVNGFLMDKSEQVKITNGTITVEKPQSIYTVTFDDGIGVTFDKTVSVKYGEKLNKDEIYSLYDPDVYSFFTVGVYKDSALTIPWDFENDVITADITLFIEREHGWIVEFDAGEGECSVERKCVRDGESLGTLPVATRKGYKFLGWFTDETAGTEITAQTVIDDYTVAYALWEKTAENALTLTVDTASAKAGDTVEIPVTIKNNTGFAAVEMNVDYDKTALTLTEIKMGIADNCIASAENGIIAGASANDITGDGTLFTLVFAVSEKAGEGVYDIEINVTEFYNADDKNLNPIVINGQIEIADYILGDANGDGAITSRDATRILQYIVGSLGDKTIDLAAADYNGDGSVSSRDATAILRYIIG